MAKLLAMFFNLMEVSEASSNGVFYFALSHIRF